jgi:hypothetical protein
MSESHFFEKLQKRVETTKSMLCIGLDPHVSQLPEHTADAAAAFCTNIIEKTHLYAAAYKPNSAFFEAFGAKGFDALIKVMKVPHTKIHIYNVLSLSGFQIAVNVSNSSFCSENFFCRRSPLISQLSSTIREEILTLLPRRMRHLHSRFSMQVL